LQSGGLSGDRNLHEDLTVALVPSGRDRVLWLKRVAGISAQRGYRRPKGYYGGKPYVLTANLLERQFEVEKVNDWWVSDITYINTHEGFLFLSLAMDLNAPSTLSCSVT